MAIVQAPWQWYGPGLAKILNKEVDLDSDNIVMTLHTSSYSPNRSSHAYVSSLSNEVANGSGYTTGGKSLASLSLGWIADTSLAAAAVSTAYVLNELRRPATANGFIYQVIQAGTSSGTAPTWPTTVGATVTDGTVVWACVGIGYVRFDAADVSWAASTTFSWRYAVISDRTPGSAATQPLLAVLDAGSTQTNLGGSLDFAFSGVGILGISV